MRKWQALALVSWMACAAPAADLAARADAAVRQYADAGQFMGAVLIARGGEVLFSKAYGSANLEWEVPNTPETKFRLGSITKQFTAACILLLEEHGKLRVADPVGRYLPDAPTAWSGITLHHVLTHTSGIPNFTAFAEYPAFQRSPATAEKTVALFRSRPLDFAPGTAYRYSNSGYVLLGHIIEQVSGVPYARFLRENVLEPLGMKDTGYDLRAPLIPRRASGYTRAGKAVINAAYVDMTVPHAAGALYSTPADLLRWQEALFGGKLLRPASLARMITPERNGYGYGVMVEERGGRRRVAHGGGIPGFNTFLAHYPQEKLTVVVLSNLNGNAPPRIAAELGELARPR